MSVANSSDLKNHIKKYEHYLPVTYVELLKKKIKEKCSTSILISDKFIGFSKQYKIKCKRGHVSSSNDYYITNGLFSCGPCTKIDMGKKIYINLLHKVAELYGGKFLSNDYEGQKTKLEFECKNNHKWKPLYANIVEHFTWCGDCPRLRKEDKQKIIEIIKQLKNSIKKESVVKNKYSSKEMEYIKKYKDIYNENSVAELEKKLKEKYPNARLEDTKFRGYCTGYPIICEIGHHCTIRDDNIMSSNFICRNCNQFNDDSYAKLKKIAEDKNGKLLSYQYKGDRIHLTWRCINEHVWKATPNNIKAHGSWCPYCISYTNEERCRVVLDRLLDIQLTKQNPKFLRYKFDKSLELDGYNEQAKIAFEYNGIQHYEIMYYDHPKIHTDLNYDNDGDKSEIKDPSLRLNYQKEKDSFKEMKCKNLGIKLLIIPYWEIKNKKDIQIIDYLINLATNNGICIPNEKIEEIKKLNIAEHMPQTAKSDKFEKLSLGIITPRKGKLIKINLTDKISSNRTKFNLQCRFGHIEKNYYENIYRTYARNNLE